MNRGFSIVASTLGVVAFAGLQAANADTLPMRASSNFGLQYEMDSSPATQDLDGVTGYDFAWEDPKGAGTGTYVNGVFTMPDAANDLALTTDGAAGTAWAPMSWAKGFTVEVRLQAAQTGSTASFDIEAAVKPGDNGILRVGDTSLTWGILGQQQTLITGLDNSSTFHTYRIAQAAYSDTFSVWRDGVQVASELTTGYAGNIGGNGWLGAFGAYSGGTRGPTQIDYIRIDGSGAYAPVPEPSSIAILVSAAMGLLAYAWRKRT